MSFKKKNIVWLHSHFLYWMGGTKFIFEVAKKLIKHKKVSSLVIIVENASDLTKNEFKKEKIELISLNSSTSTSPFYWLTLPLNISRNVNEIKSILDQRNLTKKNTTIISSMFPMNVVAKKLNYKHIQNCYEPFAFFYDEEFIKRFSMTKQLFIKFLKIVYSRLDINATRSTHKVLTLNKITASSIKETYGVKTALTYVGVRSNFFKKYVSKKIRSKYKNKKVIVHSTDYSPVKGTDLIISLMPEVLKKVPTAQLLITTTIDDPKAKKDLTDLAIKLKIRKHVTFLGFVPINDLPQYYSLAKVLVQGSFSEKSGTTSMALPVKEALCCETPAIRPDVGGDDVINEISGYLVDPRNSKKMVKKIVKILKVPGLSKQMGKRGRKYIKKGYTWYNTANVFAKYL